MPASPPTDPPRTGGEFFLVNWSQVRMQLAVSRVDHFAVPEAHRYKFGIPSGGTPALVSALRALSFQPGTVVEYQFLDRWHRYLPFATPTRLFGRPARYRVRRHTGVPGLNQHPDRHACLLEIWEELGDVLESRHDNAVSSRIARDQPRQPCLLDGVTPIHASHLTLPPSILTDFPIDVVYTWVNGADPDWRVRREMYRASNGLPAHPSADSEARYADRDELRYSLRALCLFADFFRNVYIVTAGQTPKWLDTSHPRLRVVDHRDIFRPANALPTFNSHAIESQLHHIDGLAEHFLYLNDDLFFLRPQAPENYFSPNGLAKVALSRNTIPTPIEGRIERPIDSASQATQLLIADRFQRLPTHKPQHAPHPLLRSVLENLEQDYPDLFEATARSRFRSVSNISVASSLFAYHALASRQACMGSTHSRYVDINDPLFPLLVRPIQLVRRFDSLCLNEVNSGRMPGVLRDWIVARLLNRLFPVASPFEIAV